MKIGIDIRCFARGKATGIEGYTKNFLQTIFAHDTHNEYHLFFNAWKDQAVDLSWLENYPHVFVHAYHIPNKLLNMCLWFLQYPKLDRLCGGVDLFFMPNANFCALSSDVPLILTVHDLSFEHYAQTFSWRMRAWHFLVNVRLLVKRSAHVIAVSEATKTDLMHTYGTPSSKISVAHNGRTVVSGTVDRNSFSVLSVKERYALPYHFILYFGTIEPRKNITSIVRAYEVFRVKEPDSTYKLVIAGAHGWRMEDILATIDASQYRHDMIVITDVPEEDKEPLFVLASVLVYPSFFEGFGFPPLESLICNTPVITSHVSSLPEVVGRHAVMIDPYRVEELSCTLHEMITGRQLKERFIKDAHHMHVRRFTWTQAADIFFAAVKRVQERMTVAQSMDDDV